MLRLWIAVLACLAFACVEDKVLPGGEVPIDTTKVTSDTIAAGSLIVNEFIARACPGSAPKPCRDGITYTPTESDNGKWFEIKNMTTKPILLKEGNWYFTDAYSEPDKYMVKGSSVTIPSLGFIVVCTDNLDMLSPDGVYHTDFSLSSDSGAVAIFYNKDEANTDIAKFRMIDGIRYSTTGFGNVLDYSREPPHTSYGRPNNRLGGFVQKLVLPTPGAAN